ncbi:MAG: hypothetical protein WD824_03145 [Cyclobacteriaceae bacterium]
MNKPVKRFSYLLWLLAVAHLSYGQGMQLGEVLIVTKPALKNGVSKDAFRSYVHQHIVPAWNDRKQGVNFHLFEADRGNRKGEFLLVCRLKKIADRKKSLPTGSPFTDEVLLTRNSKKPSDILSNPKSFTEYHLLGPDEFQSLPGIGILGIHYIRVRSEKTEEFEKFVIDKMHPAVGRLLPDMHLLTYKAVNGEQKGTYITIFAIESVAARHQYWPEGKPETQPLKQAFQPHESLANDLKDYLEPGSYLEPSGGAAAIFESKEWTDYIHQPVSK